MGIRYLLSCSVRWSHFLQCYDSRRQRFHELKRHFSPLIPNHIVNSTTNLLGETLSTNAHIRHKSTILRSLHPTTVGQEGPSRLPRMREGLLGDTTPKIRSRRASFRENMCVVIVVRTHKLAESQNGRPYHYRHDSFHCVFELLVQCSFAFIRTDIKIVKGHR